MLYWYSQRYVHEVFIFITIRRREATLMIIIAGSPGNRSLPQLKPGLHISRKDRKYMVGNVYFKMYRYGLLSLSLG